MDQNLEDIFLQQSWSVENGYIWIYLKGNYENGGTHFPLPWLWGEEYIYGVEEY